MDSKIGTVKIFSPLFFYWRILGFTTNWNKYLVVLYDIFLTIFVSFFFPVHILIGILFATEKKTIFSNLTIGMSSIACTIKHFMLRRQLAEIISVYDTFQQLDERVKTYQDIQYYVQCIQKRSILIIRVYTIVYFTVSIMALLTALWTQELLYPAYVITNWRSSFWKYWLAVFCQTCGLNITVVQSLTNDAYGPIVLCLLSGHVHLLAQRVSRIGYDAEMDAESDYKALVLCIEDYKLLMNTTKLVERIISSIYMVQFTAVGINVVMGLVNLLFYADNFFSYGYFILHILAVMMQIFPCCYYGSRVQAEFHSLSYAIFRCNWLKQPRPFRRNLLTFVELSLKEVTITAGGMIRIHLDSFFQTCRMGYTFFAVVKNMK